MSATGGSAALSGVRPDVRDRVMRTVTELTDEMVDFTAELVRIPTVNPPGECYEDCARAIGARLERFGFGVEYIAAEGRPEHTSAHPRVNVVGTLAGARSNPLVHLNGHFDVVPVGDGWTVDPFGGHVRDGRIYGRGVSDMKAGIAAAIYAAEAIRRAGVRMLGTVEVSGTVDEESGGFAGVAHLAERGRIARGRTDAVIIPEPLQVDQICIGHRGVYWFEVTTHGHIAHGCMPFLGQSAIEHMAAFLDTLRRDLLPTFAERRTRLPVVPDGARYATLNINGISGGQPVHGIQTPCVADRCTAVFDRRFLIEEGFEATRREMVSMLDGMKDVLPAFRYQVKDLMVVEPVQTPADAQVIGVLGSAIAAVLGREATLVASPGTYDHKHVTRIAGIDNCVAYGPGELELAHQPDEWCSIEDLVKATQVLALSILDIVGVDA
ncbi:MAG TPA: acetylornithine deacetylase/succinyl-diaminopimelate desuccinylase family protein [Longimicrobiales bacterium]|nr:acetylornithine deacetylase/succinyl-diaminopimelate desuccinylase family protein [Longimicrobiales bacterium]